MLVRQIMCDMMLNQQEVWMHEAICTVRKQGSRAVLLGLHHACMPIKHELICRCKGPGRPACIVALDVSPKARDVPHRRQ